MTVLLPCEVDCTADLRGEIVRLIAEPRSTIDDVYRCLTRIQPFLEALGAPVGHFNTLYAEITLRVGQWCEEGRFQDPDFVNELDIQFADRYIRALGKWAQGDPTTPRSWMLVFEPPVDEVPPPIVLAALGVNAHINADLAFALVRTYDALGGEMFVPSAQYDDYLGINQIFEEAIPPLHRTLAELEKLSEGSAVCPEGDGTANHPLRDLIDYVENWFAGLLVVETRDLAWDTAGYLWRHREDGDGCGGDDAVEEPVQLPESDVLACVDVVADDFERWFAGLITDKEPKQGWEAARYLHCHRDDEEFMQRHEEAVDFVACSVGTVLFAAPVQFLLSQ